MSCLPAAFRQESKEKNKRKAEQAKKRKAEEAERQQVHEGPDFPVADPASTEPASSDYSESPAVTDDLAICNPQVYPSRHIQEHVVHRCMKQRCSGWHNLPWILEFMLIRAAYCNLACDITAAMTHRLVTTNISCHLLTHDMTTLASFAGHPPSYLPQAAQSAPQQPYIAQPHPAYQKPAEQVPSAAPSQGSQVNPQWTPSHAVHCIPPAQSYRWHQDL